MVTETGSRRELDDIGSFVGTRPSGAVKVRELLRDKGSVVHTIVPYESVLEALKIMAKRQIGALVVLDGPEVAGVISERDYARKVILIGKSSWETTVLEIMSQPAITVAPEHTVTECLSLMTDGRLRHLPVVDKDRLVGLVSIGDLVKSVISEQELQIEQFERYIRGAYPV